MSRKLPKVRVELDTHGIRHLPDSEIKIILRGADPLIAAGGRTLLAKLLKGSRDKRLLELGLDECPVYGHYRQISLEDITAKIDWLLLHDYFAIQYSGRLPMLVYTEKGWEIERETYANELMQGFDEMVDAGVTHADMSYLKDRNRGMILLLLDKLEASGKKEYIPLLKAWSEVDYKKVQQRIRQVIAHIRGGSPPSTAANGPGVV